VAHPERPWGWKVSTYLWAKSVAAGVFLVAALGLASGLASGGTLTVRATPLIGLVFLAVTTALLVLDLKRPERFLYLLFKPNWRSWLVWGGWILLAQGALGALWLLAGWQGNGPLLRALVWPMLPLAAASAGYSAFLFGQAEGRDFWQSPLLLPHLVVAALLAGAASLLLAARAIESPDWVVRELTLTLWVLLAVQGMVLLAELFSFHATQDAARAARTLTHGHLSVPFWIGVALCGIALPWALLLISSSPPASVAAAALALGGLWLWEDLWVRAGQALPLS
jgi:formate-dependent nitrite reductase membrane component NrfD